jgi:multiple sugar transport system substrate-binding protein
MLQGTTAPVSRRQLLHMTGAVALAAGIGASIIIPGRASAQQKTLKILQWKHFVPGYDTWFNETYTKAWGEKNHTKVFVENVSVNDIPNRAAEEVKAQHGHDLFAYPLPMPAYEDEVIDHPELYAECERKYGKAHDLAIKTTYNPKTQKFWGFSDYYPVTPVTNYRKDLWDAVGTVPDTWEQVRQGGRKIKLLHDKPLGFGLGGDGDGEIAIRAILYSFGASEQDADNRPALKSPAALEVFKFVKALYEETMTADVLTWDPASNNRLMLEGAGSLVLNAISIPRTAENLKLPVGEQIWLAPSPQGPVHRLGPTWIQSYVIWKFAKNIDGAKQFLVDYIGQFRHGFLASELYNWPCFPQTVPDLEQLCAYDAKATPPDKYKVLSDAGNWTTNIGYPGYTNTAVAEIYNSGLIEQLMGQAATGKLTPEEALNQADAEVQRIFQKWRERGKI